MIPVPPTAFVDANILFSRTLRDWICLLCLESSRSAYDLRWSEDVLAEWIYRAKRRNPDITDRALGGVRRNIEQAFPYTLVTGYDLASTPPLPDPHDRHVLAAALHADVDMLVTDDRRAFPENALRGKLDVYTADEFLVWVADNHPNLLRPVLDKQVAYFRKNAIVTGGERGQDRLVEALQKAGAGTFARTPHRHDGGRHRRPDRSGRGRRDLNCRARRDGSGVACRRRRLERRCLDRKMVSAVTLKGDCDVMPMRSPSMQRVYSRRCVMSGPGVIFKRCGCRGQDDRRLEQSCPRLDERRHGTWYFHCSATNLLGRSERVRRGGFPSQSARRARDGRSQTRSRQFRHPQ